MTAPDAPPRRLTVAQLVPDLHGGGVERSVLDVSRALVERDHRSLVISSGGRLVDELVQHGGEHTTLDLGRKSPWTLRHVPRLRRWLNEHRVDVLHPQSRMPAWIAFLAWRKMPEATRPRLVTAVHGLHSVSRYSAIVTRGEKIEVVSEVARRYVLDNYPRCDAERVVVNPRGVDPKAFPFGYRPDDAWRQQWRDAYPQLDGRFVVTLPGRLTRLKGHHDLLDVIAALPPRFHGLIVGGEDPKRLAYAKELRDAVTQRGLSDRVTFTGHRADIRDVLAVSDAAVSLSTKPESFGLAALESVALGRPTVGYDHGGVGEVLARVYPAGRVPRGDTAAVAARLIKIESGAVPPPAADPILGGFTLDATLERSLKLYETLVV
ncbi:MAG: glycosyltransferase family 4 protein [Planctomycetota bacterium]